MTIPGSEPDTEARSASAARVGEALANIVLVLREREAMERMASHRFDGDIERVADTGARLEHRSGLVADEGNLTLGCKRPRNSAIVVLHPALLLRGRGMSRHNTTQRDPVFPEQTLLRLLVPDVGP
jgi:hypothetical protein